MMNIEELKEERLAKISERLLAIKNEEDSTFENLEAKGGFDRVYKENYEKLQNLRTEELELTNLTNIIERYNVKVGDGVTVNYYSDSQAYTVIARTKTTITIQRDKATLSKDFKPDFSVGGFAAHCNNQNEQSYTYERDEDGRIETAHWSKKRCCFFVDKSLSVSVGRKEFYDYNF